MVRPPLPSNPSGLVLACVLLAAACVLLPTAAARADGSATDDAAPNPWLTAPTRPKATPCAFQRVLLTTWTKQGAGKLDQCRSGGIASFGLASCKAFPHCESYSNAAVLASEIYGYTWADDSQACQFDECASADAEGISTESVVYVSPVMGGCQATIAGTLRQQFRWRVEGRGNVEVEVAGWMQARAQDLDLAGTTISGGKSAYVGDNAAGAPGVDDGTVTLGKPPFVIQVPLSVFDTPVLPADEQIVFFAGPQPQPTAVPLGLAGERVDFRGYCRVRSYADEPTLGTADVQGWIRDSNPGFEVTLTCKGGPACTGSTRSTYKR